MVESILRSSTWVNLLKEIPSSLSEGDATAIRECSWHEWMNLACNCVWMGDSCHPDERQSQVLTAAHCIITKWSMLISFPVTGFNVICGHGSVALWLAAWYLAWVAVQSFQWEASPGCSWPLPRRWGPTWALSWSWSPLSCCRSPLQKKGETERRVSITSVTSKSSWYTVVPEEGSRYGKDWGRRLFSTAWGAITSSRLLPINHSLILCSVWGERKGHCDPAVSPTPERFQQNRHLESINLGVCSVCARRLNTEAPWHLLSHWPALKMLL